MYSVKVLPEPKFKPNELSDKAVYEQEDESNSSELSASSLLTEEDSSGNPLPPEIIEIRRKNKQMQKDLTNGLMNYKSSSRSLIESEDSEDSEEDKKSERNEKNKGQKSEKKETSAHVKEKNSMKAVLEQILKLSGDLEEAKRKVNENKQEIGNKEEEFLQLSRELTHVENSLRTIADSRKVTTKCECYII